MAEAPFKIFPSRGHINTQFQLIRFDEDCKKVIIQKDDTIIKTIEINETKYVIINEFTEAGIYQAKCILNGIAFIQTFEVKDSIRFGTSELKSAFTFEDLPYSFFLMKDRILIYDEHNKYLIHENNISPTELRKIGPQHLLFKTIFKHKKDKIIKYAIFSMIKFKIIWELKNEYKEILLLADEKLLWIHNFIEHRVVCFSFKELTSNGPTEILNLKIDNFFEEIDSYNLFIENDDSILLVNLKKAEVNTIDKQNNIAIDKQGNYYKLTDGFLNCNNLLTNQTEEITYELPFTLNLCQDNFLYIGEEFVENKLEIFENATNELIRLKQPSNEEKKSYININLISTECIDTIYSCHSLFNSSTGIILLTKEISRKISSMYFKKDSESNWKGTPRISTSYNYALSFIAVNQFIELKKPISSVSLVFSNQVCSFFNTDSGHLILKEGKIITGIDSSAEKFILNNFGQNNYLLVSTGNNKFSMYSFDNFNVPIIKEAEVFNKKYLRKHGVIWYSGKEKNVPQKTRLIAAYDLKNNKHLQTNENFLKHSIFKDAADFKFTEDYILSSSQAIIHPKNGEVKDAVVGNVMASSECLNKIISRRDNLVYLSQFDRTVNKFIDNEIEIPITKYKEAYLSPNGKFLMLKTATNQYVLLDIEKGNETNFFSGKFLAFSKEGNLIYEENNTRAAKIIDPLTFQDITPPNYHYFRFLSPDGKLYSHVSTKKRYYDKINCQYTDVSTLTKFQAELDLPFLADEETKSKIMQNRNSIFTQHKAKFEELGINEHNNINANSIIKIEVFTEIGIVGTNVITEVHFPADLAYFNYAAFSYDNNYFGYVGKPSSRGLIHILKLDYNPQNKTLIVVDSYLSRHPRLAAWVCGFSKQGYFATYDSTPDTYIIKTDEELFQNKHTDKELKENLVQNTSTIYSTFSKWIEIKGKNFLCFSPSGRFTALSEQGYEPLTLGGYGHQESGALHLALTSEWIILDSFLEHGEKVDFVAFSEDETKILSMSKDGVVIVRNIEQLKDKTPANNNGIETNRVSQ
ncbi:MAG: hypothetical protein H0U27_07530 [Nitrosopumilus sp.]|nr:hypothetical protein [Nitrosopumilus sp.]